MRKKEKTIRLKNLRMPQCKKCKLHKSTKNICILGKGNVDAPIFLVGEAPGAAEARTGNVFCGKAGKFLDRMLHELEMINLVYITNAVHCRPLKNRTPFELEIETCKYFLEWEISIVNPQIIIPMGKVAMKGLGHYYLSAGTKPFPDSQWDVWINPTWHPSYCLRRGEGATNDLRKVLKWAKRKIA